MTAPKRKNHHYVPRFLLRGFSSDAPPHAKTVSLVVLETGKRIDGAAIGDQCSEDYFYGTDPAVEEGFGETEAQFANILGNLSRERLESINADASQVISSYVHFQRIRTRRAANGFSQIADSVLKAALSSMPNAPPREIMDAVSIEMENPQFETLIAGASGGILLADLEVKFLVAPSRLGFVLSDDPVIHYNQFAEHHPRFGRQPVATGLAHTGLQIFMPLSSAICLCLYDPYIYEYGSRRSRMCTAGMRDVRLLNELQVAHANRCIYFDHRATPNDELTRLLNARRSSIGWRKTSFNSSRMCSAEGRSGRLLIARSPEFRVGARFNFVRHVDNGAYDQFFELPCRSEELVAAYQQLSAEILGPRAPYPAQGS